jgi:DNA-binding NarL/FixJ family response regulator
MEACCFSEWRAGWRFSGITLEPLTMNDASVGPINAIDDRPTILLADDNQRILDTVSRLLRLRFRVVGAVNDGQMAVEAASRLMPDLVVLDITMPGLDGIQAARDIKRVSCHTKILFLTGHESVEYVSAALDLDAQGCVFKSRMYSDLIMAIEQALTGRVFISSSHTSGT